MKPHEWGTRMILAVSWEVRKKVELRSMPTHRERQGRDEWGTRFRGYTSHVSESRHGAPGMLGGDKQTTNDLGE